MQHSTKFKRVKFERSEKFKSLEYKILVCTDVALYGFKENILQSYYYSY